MVYWNEWKSLIGGGIGFIILGIFMMILSSMPNASGAVGPGGLSIMQIGIIFLIGGIVMFVLGLLLRKT